MVALLFSDHEQYLSHPLYVMADLCLYLFCPVIVYGVRGRDP